MEGRIKNELVLADSYVCDNVYCGDTDISKLKMSKFFEISFVIEGNGIHRILNETDECHAGDMYILGGGIHHAYFAKSEDERPTVRTISFDPSLIFEGEWADPMSDHFCCGVFRDKIPVSYAMLNGKAMAEVEGIYSSIIRETTEKGLEWRTALRSHLKLLLITLSRYINLADTVKHGRPKEWVTVSAALREVLDRFGDSEMTLESIAASLFISKSHLSRMFKKITGESFMDNVRRIRLDQACELLKTTSLTNEEIVGRCGLKDIPSFYRLFKNYMGMTPYQYRMSRKTYEGEKIMSIYIEISENIQRGKAKVVKELVEKAIADGLPAAQILNEGLLAGMNVVGEKFKNNEVYVPEVLVAARAMNMGVSLLKPLLVEDGVSSVGRVCIGTVKGDLHDIGKNLVKMMMEGKGLEVIDLGTDVAPETFIQTAIEQDCKVICCSALLTTTMEVMEEVVKQADAAGIRDKIKIMIGGAPVNESFCEKIGADKYTSDAASAADAAVEFCRA